MRKYFLIPLLFISFLSYGQISLDTLGLTTSPSGLKFRIVNPGNGKSAQAGDKVWVHYLGMLNNDSIFANTMETGEKDVYLGQGQLIKAWEEALPMLKEGGEIVLVVPPELGYGSTGYYGIPANATLYFNLKLVQVDKGEAVKPFDVSAIKEKETNDGIRYYALKEGDGELAKPGDNAYVHYSGFLSDGSLFDTSRKKGKPVRITVGSGHVFKGWDMALQMMKVGSKYRVIIPPELAYGKNGYKNIIPSYAELTLDIEMIKLTPEIKVRKWQAENRDTLVTQSGLKYIIFNEGKGDLIQSDQIVEVHYSGYFSDGKLFDSSVKRDEPIKFPVGGGIVIDGWDEGATYMRKGARFQFIIPPNLAYGNQGAPPQIPANATLIFDIEVTDIIK